MKFLLKNNVGQKIFLLDCIGALTSAAITGIILPFFLPMIGVPADILFCLAIIAMIFAVCSLYSYFRGEKYARGLLKIIIFANLLYCLLIGSVVFLFFDQLTALGITYFSAEMAIMLALAAYEQRVLKKADIQ